MSDLLENALNGEVIEPEQVAPEPEAEVIEAVEETKPAVEEIATPTVEETQPVESPEIAAFKAKALDETQKRQNLETQLNDMRQKMEANQQPKQDFWENPEEVLSGITQQFDSRLQQMNTNLSVNMMKTIHQDYDEKESEFIEAAQSNPALIMQMNNSDNPAKFAYDYATNQRNLAEMQDPNYREKLKAEVRAEIEAESKGKIEAEIQKRSELTGSLSTARATGGNQSGSYNPPDLEAIIG